MSEDNPIDSNLLKRMMMGEYSSQSSHDEHTKGNKRQKNNVLDLHFNKLYPSKSFLSPNEKLNLQLVLENPSIIYIKWTPYILNCTTILSIVVIKNAI